jgi:hypothetical protein
MSTPPNLKAPVPGSEYLNPELNKRGAYSPKYVINLMNAKSSAEKMKNLNKLS